MWEIFNPILAWLRDLLDNRLTTARATKLDNLDAAISTRAPANTALSNTVWTAGHAAVLANAAQADTALLAPPMTNGIVKYNLGGSQIGLTSISASWPSWLSHASGPVGTSWVDVVNIVGSGVISLAAVQVVGTGYFPTLYMDIIIDGNTVISYAQGAQSNSTTAAFLIGLITGSMTYGVVPVLEEIPFETSLQVRVKSSSATYTVEGVARVRRNS